MRQLILIGQSRRMRGVIAAPLLLIPLLFGGCEGGGDLSMSEGGIGGSGIVSGFGSVIIGGTPLDTAEASITINDVELDESALQVGMFATFQADSQRRAQRIAVLYQLGGAIEALDRESGQFQVLGRTVRTDLLTRYSSGDLDALTLGSGVRINGIGDESGLLARYVLVGEDLLGSDGQPTVAGRIDLRGEIDAVAESSFELEGVAVDVSMTEHANLPGELRDGDQVEVIGELVEGTVIAREVTLIDATALGRNGDQAQLEGVIAELEASDSGARRFQIDGITILVDAATAPQLTPVEGQLVRVEGRFIDEERVIAEQILLRENAELFVLNGEVDGIDLANATLDIEGVTITVAAETLLLDVAGALRRFALANLTRGDRVELVVRGGATGLTTLRLERVALSAGGSL